MLVLVILNVHVLLHLRAIPLLLPLHTPLEPLSPLALPLLSHFLHDSTLRSASIAAKKDRSREVNADCTRNDRPGGKSQILGITRSPRQSFCTKFPKHSTLSLLTSIQSGHVASQRFTDKPHPKEIVLPRASNHHAISNNQLSSTTAQDARLTAW